MLNHFTFNGHSTGELGLLVSGINIYGSPSRIVEKVTIPYRSGDLLIDTGAYTNYMLTYTVDIMDNTKATAEAISKWLLGSKGYCELTDTYNPEIYRVASYYNQLDYTLSALYRYGKATITFDCKPQKYLTANQPVSLSSTLSEETSYSLSSPAMPLPITLEGNTTQNTLSGKNLIPYPYFSTAGTREGITWIIGNDGSVTGTGTTTQGTNFYFIMNEATTQVFPAGTYTVSFTGTHTGMNLLVYDGTSTLAKIAPATTGGSATFTLSESKKLRVYFNVGSAGESVNINGYVQLEQGSTPTAYEPYCGGIPSPNPDYPQEIHSVKGDNEIRVIGKNVFEFPSWEIVKNAPVYNSYGKVKLSLLPNTTYYLTTQYINNYTSVGKGMYVLVGDYTNSSFKAIAHSATGTQNGVVTTNANGELYLSVMATQAKYEELVANSQVQLEQGSTSTTYEPYKAQVYPINLGSIELNALGNYKDYFYKSDGKWYLHKAIQKIDVGTLTWARRATNIFGSNLPNGTDVTADISVHMSNYFPIQYVTGVVNTQINTIAIYKTSNITSTTNIYISLANIDTVEDLTTWFNSHATELYYPLATPTNTEITNATLISQLNALSKAKTYDGSTTIMQEGSDAQFKLSMPVPAEVTSEYKGEPIITVNEVGTIVWNDSLIKVNSAPVTINSQTLQCYYYSENKNNDVEINEFPKYEQGENYIGSTMALTVVPNYWKL